MSLVTLYTVVHGDDFKRYAARLLADAHEMFFPGRAQLVVLPGKPGPTRQGWSHVSATRYAVALEHWERLEGEWVFQIDADMRILKPVGDEILADGLTVTVHPGHPVEADPDSYPYERRESSTAYVPFGTGSTYHPGAFVGGRREPFQRLAEAVSQRVADDLAAGEMAVWYEESHLNRYLIDHPPALVLDRRYCWWHDQWGDTHQAIIMHLDKTQEEFDRRV